MYIHSMPTGDTPVSQLIEYDNSGKIIYVGESLANSSIDAPAWRIQKYLYNGNNVIAKLFADGTAATSKRWVSRANYSYTYVPTPTLSISRATDYVATFDVSATISECIDSVVLSYGTDTVSLMTVAGTTATSSLSLSDGIYQLAAYGIDSVGIQSRVALVQDVLVQVPPAPSVAVTAGPVDIGTVVDVIITFLPGATLYVYIDGGLVSTITDAVSPYSYSVQINADTEIYATQAMPLGITSAQSNTATIAIVPP